MALIKYQVKLSNFARSKATITPSNPSFPTFTADLSWLFSKKPLPSILLHQVPQSSQESSTEPSGPDGSTVVGAIELDLLSLSKPIYISFQDPKTVPYSVSPPWIPFEVNNKWTTNGFVVALPRADGEAGEGKKYCWKRTTDVNKGKKQNPVMRKIDWLHLKLLDEEGNSVATFIHDWVPGWNRGEFVFEETSSKGIEAGFEKLVILSGLGVVEYVRKVSGWSW